MTGDEVIRCLTAAAVLLVVAIAAVVSFVHIEHLAVTHGQTTLAAPLLPVSIDGTVAAASLVMLRAARGGLGTPWLARVMLGLSVVATLAANITYGARYGITGSLLSGWPAVAFIGSAEMAIGMVRRTRSTPAPGAVPRASAGLNGHAHAAARMFAAELEAGRVPHRMRPMRSPSTRTRRPWPSWCTAATGSRCRRGPGERRPVIPAHLRTWGGVRSTVARHSGLLAHPGAFHAVRSPGYLLTAAGWALIGLIVVLTRAVRWWWLAEQTRLRSLAVVAGDAKEWRALHKDAQDTRRARGLALLAAAAAIAIAGVLMWIYAPWYWSGRTGSAPAGNTGLN
jgi:Protein of unknown function (DUF2637)